MPHKSHHVTAWFVCKSGALLLPLLSLPEAKPMGVDDPGPDAMELMSSNSGSEDLWSNQ